MKTRRIISAMLLVVLAILPTMEAAAQDWKEFLNGVASAVEEKASEKIAEKIDTILIAGEWQYVKPDIKLESDNLLSVAGSELAAQKTEGKLIELLDKVGINERTVFTFNENNTYSMRTDRRTMEGTYCINEETREIIMTSKLQFQFTAIIDQNILKPSSLSLRFKADKLMAFIKHVSGVLAQKSTHKKSAEMINSLLGQYDGLTIGVELKKL